MSDLASTSLADAIAPSSAPAPVSAPAPTLTESPTQGTQPPGAGNVNPYIPPASAPQNLQTPAAPDPGQPSQPPAQTQGEQPAAPQIPPEYTQAHEWRGQIEKEAEALGGLENVPAALKWSRMLFGLEQAPEGVAPAAHFLNELWLTDKQVYGEVLSAVANEHADRLMEHLEDRVLARNEIPKDRLPEIKDFLRYGRVSATEAAHREFIGLLNPEAQSVFAKLKSVQQNFYVEQVDRGHMTLDFAEQEIQEKGILLAIDQDRAQTKERAAEAAKFEEDRVARHVAEGEITRYQKTFVEAQARKHGIAPEDIYEKVVFVAARLDQAGASDPNHPAKQAYDALVKAARTGNPLTIKPAMSRLQVIVEAAFDAYMAERSGKPLVQNGAQPPAHPGQPTTRPGQQPQFEPDKPNAGQDWSKVSLGDYISSDQLFGRTGA